MHYNLRIYVFVIAGLWTLAVLTSLIFNLNKEWDAMRSLAAESARTNYQKDTVYRRWAADHGGVYVPVTEETQPNPYLEVEEREITTPSGRLLTLINPAYMTRQVHELELVNDGVRGHITSLNPIRPANAPDDWERQALQAFEQGDEEVASVEILNGEPYLRLMRPFVTEQSCLKCHEQQGYQVGDIRGGISLSVPMAPYNALAGEQTAQMIAGHGGLWALGLIGIFFATRRIRGQQSDLSHERDQYQSLVENIPGITYSCACDENWTMHYISRQVEQVVGYPATDFIKNAVRTFASVIHPDDVESVGRSVEEAIASSERWELEYRVCHRDGTIRWVYEKGRAVLDTHGKVKFLDGFILDITHRKEADSQLREATRSAEAASVAKSQFLATMSHEIRTPMNAVLGMADLLEMTSLDETQREYLEHIKGGGDVLLSVISDILDYSAIEAGRLSVEAIPMSPHAIIDKVTAVFEANARDKGLVLRSEFEETLPTEIIGDPTRLQQILFNLIGNAIKFTERGSILIKAFVEKPNGGEGILLRIDVSDTGVGIAADQLEGLFEPFTQADNTITRRFGGSGLGLSISKRLAGLMGGRIEVASELGKGSTFSLYFPIKSSEGG